ncbi:hypothetical protein CPT_Muldoon_110 [Serratia phage Muldoon]|uniref:Transglycosylase SLT domain-containing protein n=1 Tax=Serratia phage Muldoon TaxID=2601678 RepID=A0A5P8PHD2_9CAUD|nr:hypothetical protein HYP94_gp109 [Serratia phage Muldoon]QFR56065.1 hypothetical protein CPT_Muldoon_110 [Serratia phage Muldoon]
MKKLLLAALLSASMSVSASSLDKVNFTDTQFNNLHYAYVFGEQYTRKGELRNDPNERGLGYIMAAIAWQESSAGTNSTGGKNHHAYGMFQNYLPTLRNRAIHKGLNMSDRQLINHVSKRENSAAWAYEELNYWLNVHKGDTRKALASYNAGWKVKNGMRYANDVLSKANYLKANDYFKNLE